uniref:Glycoprotein n=1 Tax=Loa loa TaxID=7209 RepID=A0A1I7W4U9_LOALO
MISEYPEYAEGLIGALFGLFFIRHHGYINNDSIGMYGGKMVWYDGTPAMTDFSLFYDHSFNPRVNKSNCYRFMTWAIENNDSLVNNFEDLPEKTIKHEYDWDPKIKLVMDKDLSYPKRCALGDHGWKGDDDEVHCFSIVYKMSNHTEQLYSIDDSICRIQRQRKRIAMYPAVFRGKDEYEFIVGKLQDDLQIDQPMFYRYHFVLFGLWYFRGAGYRWSDFSQNSNFEFIDPNFNPQLNTSQCYRFLAVPFGVKYAVPVECFKQLNILSALCMYKSVRLQ